MIKIIKSPLQNTQSSSKDQETEITWDSSSPSPIRCVLSKGKKLKRLTLGSHNRRSSSVSDLVRVLSKTSSNKNSQLQQRPKTPLLGIWMNKENQRDENIDVQLVKTSKTRKLFRKSRENKNDKFLEKLREVVKDLDNSDDTANINVNERIQLQKLCQAPTCRNETEVTPIRKYNEIEGTESCSGNGLDVKKGNANGSDSMFQPHLPIVGESPSCNKRVRSDDSVCRSNNENVNLRRNPVANHVQSHTEGTKVELVHLLHSGNDDKEHLNSVTRVACPTKCVNTDVNTSKSVLEKPYSVPIEASKSDHTLTDFELFSETDILDDTVPEAFTRNEASGNTNMIKDHDTSIADDILLAVADDAIWDESVSDEMLIRCTQECPGIPSDACSIENGDNLTPSSENSVATCSFKLANSKAGSVQDMQSGTTITLFNDQDGTHDLGLTIEDEELLMALAT
ncbi:uncharacterized protein TRIADDRAFT_57293 [Trichoplax adhaerens]|uniref:Uncharacterized protein n=1 Tax=Trichoplax adhaerens TaxID=10228 RepID=B3RZ16_TRIAD|nr:predicted protein [Trichoplax adhaerens]EDV23765.1 predicted protein [Trichoplax adhaerens]|eukprot:XP_002113291.1 predicted protein [Trichoplax adhaerens]